MPEAENQAIVRPGTIVDFQDLDWGWERHETTRNLFIKGIQEGVQEFLVVEAAGKAAGELHIFWNSSDKDEADGARRAYLCAFRIRPDLQGKGLGRMLMMRTIDRVRERGFKEVTIGVLQEQTTLQEMYARWGLAEPVKVQTVDYHDFDAQGNPRPSGPFDLYLRKL